MCEHLYCMRRCAVLPNGVVAKLSVCAARRTGIAQGGIACGTRTCKGPFSPPSTTTDPAPLGGRIGGSTPISTRGIRKTGCSHLETRPWAVFSPFRALFAVFHGPTPLTCAARGRWAVKTAVGAKETRPVRELCSDWPKTLMGRRYPPKHGALHSKPLSRPPRRSMLRRVRTGGRK